MNFNEFFFVINLSSLVFRTQIWYNENAKSAHLYVFLILRVIFLQNYRVNLFRRGPNQKF